MAQAPLFAGAALPSDGLETTFEDVMAFLDGFPVGASLNTPAATAASSYETELLFSGFSSDTSDEELLSVHSDELLSLLDTMTPPAPTAAMTMTTEVKTGVYHRQGEKSATCSTQTLSRAPESVSTSKHPVKEATRKRNAYREKMKHELQYLRLRAVEMEGQLAALRQGTTSAALSPEEKQLIDSSWQRIATHQLEARRESEAENARLKGVLQDHMAMARGLEQSLGKRLNAPATLPEIKSKAKRGRTSKTWANEGFTDLANDLDSSFDRLHVVMRDSGLDKAVTDTARNYVMKTSISPSGVVTPYIELTDTAITPFHPKLTAKAVWKTLLNQYFHESRADSGVEKIWQTGCTFAAKSRTKYTVKSGGAGQQQEVYLKCKIVLRKFIDEESRMVLVWRAHNEGEGEHAGVYADETGWSVVQSMAGSSIGSVIQTCIHLVQRHRETASVQHPSVGVLTDLVVASNQEDMIGLTKAVENLLLHEGKVE